MLKTGHCFGLCETNLIHWHDVDIPMQNLVATMEQFYYIEENQSNLKHEHVKGIFDTEYDSDDLNKMFPSVIT